MTNIRSYSISFLINDDLQHDYTVLSIIDMTYITSGVGKGKGGAQGAGHLIATLIDA